MDSHLEKLPSGGVRQQRRASLCGVFSTVSDYPGLDITVTSYIKRRFARDTNILCDVALQLMGLSRRVATLRGGTIDAFASGLDASARS